VFKIDRDGEVREMRDAATVLEIIRERGRNGLPLERVYRCLFNPGLYLLAYGKIYRNAGAMTPGTTSETVDGMNLGKIDYLKHLGPAKFEKSYSAHRGRLSFFVIDRG